MSILTHHHAQDVSDPHHDHVGPVTLNNALHLVAEYFKGQGYSEESLTSLVAHYDEGEQKALIVWEEGPWYWTVEHSIGITKVVLPLRIWPEPVNNATLAFYLT